MAITRQSFADDTASLLQQTYQQKWLPTNWESSAAPKLPAGMTIYIGGVPYVVDTEDYTLGGSPSDGTCYIKITPNSGDGGATADAVLTNTFSGTWNEAWNDFYDSTAIFLNFFCTKATTNYTAKGQWLNYREREIQAIAGNISAVDGVFSGDVTVIGTTNSDGEINANNFLNINKDLIIDPILESGSINIYTQAGMGSTWNNGSPAKKYSIKVNGHGTIKVSFTLASGWTGTGVFKGRIYKNGIAAGTERTLNTPPSGSASFSEDISISHGDSIELWGWNPYGAGTSSFTSFTIDSNSTFSKIIKDYITE